MIRTSRFLFATTAACLLAGAPAVEAASITALDAAWPTGGVQSVDANNSGPGARGINTARVNRQGFVVESGITVEKVYLSSNGYEDRDLTVGVFAIADPLDGGSITDESTPISGIISVPAFGQTGGAGNIEIELDAAEQFFLSPGSYAFRVQGDDDSGSSFLWNHSNDGTDHYPAGVYRRDDGNVSSTRDFGFALTGAPVPEPASLLLTLLGVAGVGARRGRR